MSIFTESIAWFQNRVSPICPIQAIPPENTFTYEVPLYVRYAVCRQLQIQAQAREITNDPQACKNGLWYRTNSLADALRVLIDEDLRERHGHHILYNIELYAGWRYSSTLSG